MRIVTWVLAFVLGSLTFAGAVNILPFDGAAAVVAMVVGIVLGGFVGACVLTATEQLLPSIGERRARR